MAKNTKQATILTPKTADAVGPRKLPKSWTGAAGSMRHHKKALDKYIKEVRREWR